ncbi:MAG: hypothetical protein K2N06_01180 [Oscillospiraceae bacterium]|nr:hypothetical protein [Oscillospiraceae bacterium]
MSYVKKSVPIVMSVLLVVLMVIASTVFDEREIIFPEIAAIAIGAMISPKMTWNVSKSRIFICIVICAVCGMLIVRFLPLPVWSQMIVGYVIAQAVLIMSKTSFAPMISAMVLPIMLQTTTPIYIASAVILTAFILLCRIILEKAKIAEPSRYEKPARIDKADFERLLIRSLLASTVIAAGILTGWGFVAAPPLLVAFTELSGAKCPERKRLLAIPMIITLGALIGTGFRYLFTVTMGLSLWVSAMAAILAVILLMRGVKMYIPPAGAIAILAMLIPESALVLFSLEILIGIFVLTILARFFHLIAPKSKKSPVH